MRKFVVKILYNNISNDYTYKVINACNEYHCRKACENDTIIFIFEVDASIHHWSIYEIGLLYSWIDQKKEFLPIDHKEVIREYVANNCEKRNMWLLDCAKTFNEFMDDFYTFKQYNKCLELLNRKPLIK